MHGFETWFCSSWKLQVLFELFCEAEVLNGVARAGRNIGGKRERERVLRKETIRFVDFLLWCLELCEIQTYPHMMTVQLKNKHHPK